MSECGLHCGGEDITWACAMKSSSREGLVRCQGRIDCKWYEEYSKRKIGLSKDELRTLRRIDAKCITTSEMNYIMNMFGRIIEHIDVLSSENSIYKKMHGEV